MSRTFFIGWIVVVFMWAWVAAAVIWCLPLWEARHTFAAVFRGIMSGKRASISNESEGVVTEKVIPKD
ncbi:hypothetical protein LTR36_009096 [Oleoguttula mirabilis]|uniref:ATP synthase F0 subunit 8 n=1 Tax=Oleoguttula mirabilis TaxID=1507867 RepID=A0AAV9J846_9PEZI|nr:hypothetical protein LTR36_009096 [Oleoguttula mirabilis]